MTEFGAFDPHRIRPRPRDKGAAYVAVQHDRRSRSLESKYGYVPGVALARQLSQPATTEMALADAATVAANSSSYEEFRQNLLDKSLLSLETRHFNLEIDKTLGAPNVEAEQRGLEQKLIELRSLRRVDGLHPDR